MVTKSMVGAAMMTYHTLMEGPAEGRGGEEEGGGEGKQNVSGSVAAVLHEGEGDYGTLRLHSLRAHPPLIPDISFLCSPTPHPY